MAVVGWYPPTCGDMARDIRRTQALTPVDRCTSTEEALWPTLGDLNRRRDHPPAAS